ncbi:MAG: CoA transferase [Chloroflexi bacterium]|nr:CoA transferase [Chloroflexota bacterium]
MSDSQRIGQATEGMLEGLRVLDLTDARGYLCGKLLGDLGADVIKVERPGGDPGRSLGPFYKDIPEPEKSLYWFAFNANKRGITLNIETAQGQEIFRRLVKRADFVLESFSPGYMDSLGLGYSELRQINPRIIMSSITPFGQSGPYRDYKSSDLVDAALGGILYSNGDPDRRPVRISFPQTYQFAAVEAAIGMMMALLYLQETGEGQQVEVQAQRAVVGATYDLVPFWYGNHEIRKRQGAVVIQPNTGVVTRQMWPCKDGFVTFSLSGGAARAPSSRAMVEWMDSEGYASDSLKQVDWAAFDWSKVTQEYIDRLAEPISRFLLAHTKAELLEGAVERGILLYPLNTAKDMLQSRQLKVRQYWTEVPHPELGTTIPYPGAFIKASEAPIRMRCRAPTIGEHNEEIYKREMGFSSEELVILKQANII